jgi:hypothetical protein
MLQITTELSTPAPATFQPAPVRTITGQSIAKTQWSPRARAYLAAGWKVGTVKVEPSIKLAAEVFHVSEQLVRQAVAVVSEDAWLEREDAQVLATPDVLNGTPVMPPNPVESLWWTGLSQAEQDDFVRAHFDSVWSSVDRITR